LIIVEEYIKKSLKFRQKHLNLNENCVLRGGNSTKLQGLLAFFLDTSIPEKYSKILLCHACGNEKCGNPKHLYWGTQKENVQDAKRHGTFKSGWENLILKYGEKEAREIIRVNFEKGRKIASEKSKGKKLSKKSIRKRTETRKKNKTLIEQVP
jgi:hypothetical protein